MSDDDRVQPQDENQAQDENPPEHLDAGVGLDNAFFELNSKGAGGYSDEEPATEMDGNSKYEPSPSKRTKNKKKKSKQRRKRRRESSSSSSSSSSDSSDSSDDDKSPPEKRFRVVSKEEEHKWDLPSDMALYANKYFHEYVPEKDIQEKILDQDPVPSNITEHKKLDDFVKSAVKSTSSIMNDQSLEKIQVKVGSVMGPLSKLWRVLEGVKTSPGDNVDVPVDLCVTLVHKCVLLLGQASNALSYNRRFNLLSNMLNDPRRAKSVLKEKAPVLQTNDENLFGKKFRSYVIETERSKKKTVEAFASESRKQPFQRGPSSQSTKKSGGGGRYTYRKNNNQRGKKYGGSSYNNYNSNNNSGKNKLSKRLSLPKYAGYSSRKPTFKCPSLGKTYVYRRDSDFTTGRQTKIFSPSMGKTDNGQRNPVDCKRGFRDSFLQKTNSGKNSSDCSNVDRRKTNSERRNSGNATERCNSQSGQQQQKGQLCSTAVRNIRSVSKQSVYCPKKGWGKKASNKSEKSKFLYSLQTLQNGRFGQFKTFIEKRGLSYKNRLERCILYRTSVEFFQEICTFQMGRKSLRVPVSLFWFGASPSNFHQTTENSHSSSPKNQHSSDYLPGRHVINGVHFRGNKHEQGYSSFPFTTPRICNKFEEIRAGSLSQNGISGVNYRYNGNENISYREKGTESHPEMFRSVPTESSIDLRIDQVDRLTVFNHSSSTSSIITTSLSTATASAISEENQILSDSSSFNKGSESRTFVVDSKFKNTKWKENKFEGTQLSDPDRCFQRDRLGSSLQWSQDRRDLVDTGNRQTYPYSRITCSQVSLSQFHQEPSKHSHSFSDRQYNCNFLSIEKGGTKSQELLEVSKEIWKYLISKEITITAEYLPGILNKLADWESRNPITSSEWILHRSIFQHIIKILGCPQVDLFASRLCHQISQYVAWRPDPMSIATDAMQQDWNNSLGYAFPPFCMITRVLNKVLLDQVEQMIIVTPTWQTQPWYSLLLQLCIHQPVLLPNWQNILLSPKKEKHPLIKNKTLRLAAWLISGRNCKRQEFLRQQPRLSQIPEDQAHYLVTNRPGVSGLAGVVADRLIHFIVI